jgi:O-antigen/teichoic acid export membrane protein
VTRKWKFSQAAPIYAAQLCAGLMTLIVVPVVIRTLGLEIFGVYASLLTASQIGLIVSEYSFDAVGPRLLADQPSTATETYHKVLAAKLPTMIAGIALGLVTYRLITGNLPNAMDATGIVFVIVGMALLSPWFLIATQRTVLYASLVGGARVFSTVAIVLSAVFLQRDKVDGSTIFALYALPIGIAGFVSIYITARDGFTLKVTSENLRLLKHGFPAFLGTSAISIQNIFGQFMIGLIAGPSSLGIYNAMDRPARFLSSTLKPIFQTLYPHVVRLHKEDPEEAWRFTFANLRLAAIFLLPVLVICTIFSKSIIAFVYGDEMVEYHRLLPIIVAWISLGILNNFLGIQALQAAGRDKIYSLGMWLSLAIAITGSLLSIAATPYVYFVAASIVAGEFAALLIYSVVVSRSNAHRK